MNRNKLKDFIAWLNQISFEGYSKEKQIEHLMTVCVDMRINSVDFATLVKAANDSCVFGIPAIEELVQNNAKWIKIYNALYLERMIVELRNLWHTDIVRSSVALNTVSGAYGEIDHPLLIDIDSYPVNHNSLDKGEITLRWTEKYPKDDFDRYQKAVNNYLDEIRKLFKDNGLQPYVPAYSLKLPNHGVSGSFVHMNDIKAARHELDRTNTGWLFNPKHHEPIGSRYVDIDRTRVHDSWDGMVKATRDLWNAIRESFDDSNSKAYLKKNQRGKPVIAKKKHKPSGLLKALVAKKD